MRSVSAKNIEHLSPTVTRSVAKKPVPEDLVAAAIKAFPDQLKDILKQLPTPVIAPRPPGAWVIEVNRDSKGVMTKMTAKFHETKK